VKHQAESLRPPLRTVTARAAAALPDAERAHDYAFEPKSDGWLN
jgi:recombination DNA repair RAD52 pathway protein